MAAGDSTAHNEEIRHLSVLVAESNAMLQKAIRQALQEAGAAQVVAVGSGAEAWQAWKRNKNLAVLVCAANLPEMSGLDILTRIRADTAAPIQPAFVLLSSDQTPAAQQQAQAAGADAFLRKPFPTEEVVPTVVAGVRKRKEQDGGAAFAEQALQGELVQTTLKTELLFERYSTTVDCEQLTPSKCVIRVTNNYGLGTLMTLRLARADGEGYYNPLKGVVTKTERVPREIGQFLLHVQFNGPVKEHHGVAELLRSGAVPTASE